MKKQIAISVIAVGLLSSMNVQAADDLSSMFSEGKASGQIREFSIARYTKYNDSANVDNDSISHALGGHLKFETSDFKGLSLGTAFYTTNRIGGLSTNSADGSEGPNNTVLDQNANGYSILGEAFLQYKMGKTTFKGGRQKMNTPLIGADDARMIPNLFTSYNLSNTDIAGVKFTLNHTTDMAQGTFSNAYGIGGSIIGATAGYSAVATDGPGDFTNYGTYAVGESTSGITSASVTYTGVEGLKVQLWDYYSHDIVNSIYADVSYKMKMGSVTPFVAAQLIKQDSVGDQLLKNNTDLTTTGDIDSIYYGVKAGVSVAGATVYAAYSETGANSDTDDIAKNAIILMSGGYPIYTQGMVTRHMTFAGSKTIKAAASYSFKKMGPDLKTVIYYVNVDLDKNNGYTGFDKTEEKGFDIIYNTDFVKNLQLRLRGNYVTDWSSASATSTADGRDWSEYRFIANYSF